MAVAIITTILIIIVSIWKVVIEVAILTRFTMDFANLLIIKGNYLFMEAITSYLAIAY